MNENGKENIIDWPLTQQTPSFAHDSEAEFARILDFYCIDWKYEPRTFPLRWNETGHLVESFSPDFYLPQFGLFIEITTCRQRLINRKRRKIRLLKELYPHINIRLLQSKDFHNLMWKYCISK